MSCAGSIPEGSPHDVAEPPLSMAGVGPVAVEDGIGGRSVPYKDRSQGKEGRKEGRPGGQ